MDDRDSSAENRSKVVSLTVRRQQESQADSLKELAEIFAAEISSDEKAISDHEFFHDRFGFDWAEEKDRKALIDLKHAYSLKDREIRMFFVTRNIKLDPEGATLIAYPWTGLGASVAASVAGFAGILILIATVGAYIHGSQSAIIGVVLSLFFFATTAVLVRLQIAPALTQYRVKKRHRLFSEDHPRLISME